MKKSIPFLNLGPELDKETTIGLRWQDDIFFINSYELPEMCHEPFQTDFSLIFLMKKGKTTGVNKYFKRRTDIFPAEYRKRHYIPSRERSDCAPRAPQAH